MLPELATLFAWSFLAATILPLGSEPALAAVVARSELLALPVLVATAGNYLGACTTYLLARAGAEAIAKKKASPTPSRNAARAFALIRRYGAPALLLSWVPIVGDAIVAAAGAARMSFIPFSLFTITGKGARYVLIALAAEKFL